MEWFEFYFGFSEFFKGVSADCNKIYFFKSIRKLNSSPAQSLDWVPKRSRGYKYIISMTSYMKFNHCRKFWKCSNWNVNLHTLYCKYRKFPALVG